MTGELPPEARELFTTSPGRFVPARDELASRLRAEGRDDDAAAVKALRKPTIAVWALDQLADRDPDGVQALIDAGAELRAAQQAAVSSSKGGAERLRTATTVRKAAVVRLTAEATAALEEAGRPVSSQADTITAALEAASIDPEQGAELAAGLLQRLPEEPAGFGSLFGLTGLEGGDASDKADVPASKKRGDSAVSLKADVSRLRRDHAAAERDARRAREAADGFARELDGMRERLGKVEAKHAEAAARADRSTLELKRVERALARATERLDGAQAD